MIILVQAYTTIFASRLILPLAVAGPSLMDFQVTFWKGGMDDVKPLRRAFIAYGTI